MTEREAWEVAFEEYKETIPSPARDLPNVSREYYFIAVAPVFRAGYQAALASRQGAESVAIQLDPKWKWISTDTDGEEWAFADRPHYRDDRWFVTSESAAILISGSDMSLFTNLKPSTLYEIIDGRFVERESHA